MFSRRPVPRLNRGRIASSVASDPTSLLNLPNAANLYSWHDVDYGITLSSTLLGLGSAPVAQTGALSGTRAQTAALRIEITTGGVNGGQCRATLHGGYRYYAVDPTTDAVWNDYSGAFTSGTPITFSNGLIWTPAAGTYATDQVYLAKVGSWAARGTAAATCTLDEATLSSSGPVVEWRGYNDYLGYNLHFNGSALANQSGMPLLVTGTNVPFSCCEWNQIVQLAGVGTALRPWSFSNQNVASNSKNILDAGYSGSGTTPDTRWFIQRRDNVPNATKQCVSTAVPDLSPHNLWWVFDGTNAEFSRNNIADGAAQNIATGGTTTVDRFVLGGSKYGTGALTNFFYGRMVGIAFYNVAVSQANRTIISLARS